MHGTIWTLPYPQGSTGPISSAQVAVLKAMMMHDEVLVEELVRV